MGRGLEGTGGPESKSPLKMKAAKDAGEKYHLAEKDYSFGSFVFELI